MSKWKHSYEFQRKYKVKWEKQFTWLEKMADGSENAFCTLCCKILQPKLSTLINHSKTNDHVTQEEFYHLERANESPPCKLKKPTDCDTLSSGDDSDEDCEDAKEFGSYVIESLLSVNSNENREKLKELIRNAVDTVTKLDVAESQRRTFQTEDNPSDGGKLNCPKTVIMGNCKP